MCSVFPLSKHKMKNKHLNTIGVKKERKKNTTKIVHKLSHVQWYLCRIVVGVMSGLRLNSAANVFRMQHNCESIYRWCGMCMDKTFLHENNEPNQQIALNCRLHECLFAIRFDRLDTCCSADQAIKMSIKLLQIRIATTWKHLFTIRH